MTEIICFSGPASSGKTTMVNSTYHIVRNFYTPNVCTVNEVVRTYASQHHLSLEEVIKDLELFEQFQYDCLELYRSLLLDKLDHDYDVIISDRSPIDFDIYFSLVIQDEDRRKKYRTFVESVINDIENVHIIYCKPLKFVKDGFRTEIYKTLGENELFEHKLSDADYVLEASSFDNRLNDMICIIKEILGDVHEYNTASK